MEEQKESAPNQYETTIAGKQVSFRRQLRLKEYSNIISRVGELRRDNLLSYVPLCCMLIESWEFDGDPADPAAYDDLDAFVAVALIQAVEQHANERTGLLANPKAG